MRGKTLRDFSKVNKWILVLIAGMVLLTTTVAGAEEWHVYKNGTGDYPTIQAAIDDPNTVDGDIITVHKGTYKENIDFKGKAITVRSDKGAAFTTLDGSQNGCVVAFRSGEGPNSVLDGFTITKGSGEVLGDDTTYTWGGGISCTNSSSPLITNCTISGNSADFGGGISCYLYCEPRITNCSINNNKAVYLGGGISLYARCMAVFYNCDINDNSAGFGGGIYCYFSNPQLIDSMIIGNSAGSDGGGIVFYVHPYANPPTGVINCTISGNSAVERGGGIFAVDTDRVRIANSIISDNSADLGGAIYFYLQTRPLQILNCTIRSNLAHNGGGGILFSTFSDGPTIRNSILWNNTVDGSPNDVLLDHENSSLTIDYSDFNPDYITGIGILIEGSGNINLPPLLSANDHLQSGSPCIDQGTSSGVPKHDFEGDPRLSFVGGDDMPDMGADEFYVFIDCDPDAEWKNHGQYVKCVAGEVKVLVSEGIIDQEEGDAINSEAKRSDIGKK
jgi:parallel beta-helix repeat protein